jgi:hypothetical protein
MNDSYPFAARSITWSTQYDSNPDSKYHSDGKPFPALTLQYADNNGEKEYLYCYPRTKSFEAMENTNLVK